MLRKLFVFAIAILLASAAFSQSVGGPGLDKVFSLANTPTPQGRQELANAVRVVAQAIDSVDIKAGTLAVRGSAAQLAISEWVLSELDRSAPSSSTHKYVVPGAVDEIVRVFYLNSAQTPQALQELVNTIRSIVEVQKIMVCNGPKAIAMRAGAAQVAATEWLVNELDRPAGPSPTTHEFRMGTNETNSLIRVFQLPQTATPQTTQEFVNIVRSICDLQRVVAYNPSMMITLRGSNDQVLTADWLLRELETTAAAPIADSPPLEFRMAGVRDPVVHLVYLNHVTTPQAMAEIANTVRTTVKIPRTMLYAPSKVLVMRGSSADIAAADQIVKERNQ